MKPLAGSVPIDELLVIAVVVMAEGPALELVPQEKPVPFV
jgi:hypothetical protein